MKGFIKIETSATKVVYINIKAIISFKQQMSNIGTEIIVTDYINKITIYTTSSTPEEVADMIELANN